MFSENSINIRKFENRDRDQVRSISYDTAFMGQPASIFFEGKEVICDALSLYFTDYEPESCFVAEVNSKVIGYLMGAKDKLIVENVFKDKIMFNLFYKALKSGVFLNKKNITFIFRCLMGMFMGSFVAPDLVKDYPAILHINVKEEFRGQRIGATLIAAYLEYLKINKISGVQLATMSQAGAGFFSNQGFRLLHEGKRPYFRHILHKDVPVFIYGKRLENL